MKKNTLYVYEYLTSSKSQCSGATVHRAIKSSEKVWLKQYVDINIQLKKKSKNDF